jgi:hypothetical protein
MHGKFFLSNSLSLVELTRIVEQENVHAGLAMGIGCNHRLLRRVFVLLKTVKKICAAA